MNTQHLELAVKIAETGSISKAAAALFISQPNASTIIKSLEESLGLHIFRRTSSGMYVTKEGEAFIHHARMILQHENCLKRIKDSSSGFQLRLGVTSYSPLITAFQRLYSSCADTDNIKLFCKTMALNEALDALCHLELDLYACLCPNHLEASQQKLMEKENFLFIKLHKLQMCVNLRKEHPLISSEGLDLKKLCDYPYIDYISANLADVVNQHTEKHIAYKYRVTVDDRTLRCEMVSSSDAFSIGCQLPKEHLEKYGLVSYPIRELDLYVGAIFRKEDQNRREIICYLQFLETILNEME